MGAGIAKVISDRWPVVKSEYLKFCYGKRSSDLLGKWQMVQVEPEIFVCNIFGQLSYGRERGRCYTDYNELENALRGFRNHYESAHFSKPIFYPKMGCNLGGAKWEKVGIIIESVFDGLEHYLVVEN